MSETSEQFNQILTTINDFSTRVDMRFDSVENQLNRVENQLGKVEGRSDKVEGQLDKVEGRLDKVESNMVTKDYLDIKLADLRGDLIVLTRKEDSKLKTLVKILIEKNLISEEDKQKIYSLEPFPEL